MNNDPTFLYLLEKFVTKYELPAILAKKLENLVKGSRIFDILSYLPRNIIERHVINDIKYINNKFKYITIKGIVTEIIHNSSNKHFFRIKFTFYNDPKLIFYVSFFYSTKDFIYKTFKINQELFISGKFSYFNKILYISHPDYILPSNEFYNIPRFEPVYPLSHGISNIFLRKIINYFLDNLNNSNEWLEDYIIAKFSFLSFKQSLYYLHNPNELESDYINNNLPVLAKIIRKDNIKENSNIVKKLTSISRSRLAFDEILAYKISLKLLRHKKNKNNYIIINGDFSLRNQLLASLKFSLTNDQEKAIKNIYEAQKEPSRMYKLLQGDVGSGKTIVALFSMLNVVECGKQAIIMAPTSILAMQLFNVITELLKNTNIKIEILTGKDKGKKREKKLNNFKNGTIQIVIGTHALFQDDVQFFDLAYIIIDEQHRFGVQQRKDLAKKSNYCDILLMSATPIPRSLSLALYGDLDIIYIKEKPVNKASITTSLLSNKKLDKLIERLKLSLDSGNSIYWICPIVEEKEDSYISDVTSRFKKLSKIFGEENVGILHGKLKENAKNKIIDDFSKNKIKLLVTTTVIEVGLSVKNATIIIIDYAEYFGLAQLHQLRGRVWSW